MSSVYSVRLGGGISTKVEQVNLYTVPPGHVVIVRDVVAFAGPTAATIFELFVGSSLVIALATIPAPYGAYIWSGRQVIEAGETLQLAHLDVNSVGYGVSGYLLTT